MTDNFFLPAKRAAAQTERSIYMVPQYMCSNFYVTQPMFQELVFACSCDPTSMLSTALTNIFTSQN
jgi:hypothetical protein